eukprot:1143243-Pelagomonas_calceolata.AAC.3
MGLTTPCRVAGLSGAAGGAVWERHRSEVDTNDCRSTVGNDLRFCPWCGSATGRRWTQMTAGQRWGMNDLRFCPWCGSATGRRWTQTTAGQL